MEKYLYFMEETDGAFDAANDAMCRPLSQFRGFGIVASTTSLEMHFDSMLGTGADIAAVDKVVLTVTANTQKKVMQDIVRALNSSSFAGGDNNFLVIADDTNSVYASSDISGCAITVTAAA
jgi:hypothetical protein|tara:strand:+ start:166 stop:528 length:363 start_codon:yes stop_codon:yes gene_type:complete